MYSKWDAGREERMEKWMDAWQLGQKTPEAVCASASVHVSVHGYAYLLKIGIHACQYFLCTAVCALFTLKGFVYVC